MAFPNMNGHVLQLSRASKPDNSSIFTMHELDLYVVFDLYTRVLKTSLTYIQGIGKGFYEL